VNNELGKKRKEVAVKYCPSIHLEALTKNHEETYSGEPVFGLRLCVVSFSFIFVGWGETETTWYIGH
jgi:hypothetical protein